MALPLLAALMNDPVTARALAIARCSRCSPPARVVVGNWMGQAGDDAGAAQLGALVGIRLVASAQRG